MNWLERLRTTLRADAHGMIDSLEDKALLLKQHVRDAEQAVRQKRARLDELVAEHMRLENDNKRVHTEHARHEADAELALSAGEDGLAKKALSRVLPLAQLKQRIYDRLVQNQQEQAALTTVLATQEAELSALRSRVEAYLASQAAGVSAASFVPAPVTDDEIEIELLRRKRARAEKSASEEHEP